MCEKIYLPQFTSPFHPGKASHGPACRHAADGASAAAGGTTGISPSNIFDVGIQLGNQVLGQVSAWSPGVSVGLIISALVQSDYSPTH